MKKQETIDALIDLINYPDVDDTIYIANKAKAIILDNKENSNEIFKVLQEIERAFISNSERETFAFTKSEVIALNKLSKLLKKLKVV